MHAAIEPVKSQAVVAVRALRDSLSRMSNVFALHRIVPLHLSCRRSDPYLFVDVELAQADCKAAERLLDRLREMVCVDRAEVMDAGGLLAP